MDYENKIVNQTHCSILQSKHIVVTILSQLGEVDGVNFVRPIDRHLEARMVSISHNMHCPADLAIMIFQRS